MQGCSDLFKLPPLLRVLGSSPNNTEQRWGAMCVVMMPPTTVTTEPPPLPHGARPHARLSRRDPFPPLPPMTARPPLRGARAPELLGPLGTMLLQAVQTVIR